MPVVVSVHGYSETFEWYRDYTVTHEHADTAGFVLVYPLGYGRAWNSGGVDTRTIYDVDDVGYISEIIDSVHANYNVDLERVYACGFSNGGEMTYRLACELGQRFAAVASIAGCLSDIADNAPWYPRRPMPVLHFHGTGDIFEYYDGNRPGFDLWSVSRTLDFWIQRNNCTAPPETVFVPDIDPSDGTTVQKFTWGTCSDSTQIVHYKIIGGGHTWPGSVKSYDGERRKNNDISANVVMWDFFKEYENPLVNMAFGKGVDVGPLYVSPQGDSLYVTARVLNLGSHPVTARAILKGVATSYTDSVELFDDGQHWDGAAADNVYGSARDATGLEEDLFNVSLVTYDDSLSMRYSPPKSAVFTTAGPLAPARPRAVANVMYDQASRLQTFFLVLENLGSTASVGNISVEISSDDPRLTLMASSVEFDDAIPAGAADTSVSDVLIQYAEGYNPDSLIADPITFSLVIYSNGYPFWEDTLNSNDIVVSVETDQKGGVPKGYSLEQNYPNPFNPSTTIEFALPQAGPVTLIVYNVLGDEVATLVTGDHPAGTFEVTWDASALPSGVYFCRLTAGGSVQIRKAMLLR